jgi:transcriptional regulator with XRE-family HTH domain
MAIRILTVGQQAFADACCRVGLPSVAESLGVSVGYVSKLANGLGKPSGEFRTKILERLKIRPEHWDAVVDTIRIKPRPSPLRDAKERKRVAAGGAQ